MKIMNPREVLSLSCQSAGRGTLKFVRQNKETCLVLASFFILLSWVAELSPFLLLWWFLLGVSSSIGFGTGVPSRILYLIPFIMRTAQGISFTEDFLCCFPVTFVHAVGSAFGELPPFLSSAALTSYFDLDSGSSIIARTHRWILRRMDTHRFLVIVILAAYPNATFDAAGVAAGCSKMTTHAFLLATIIGKAFIRAPLACTLVLFQVHYPWVASILPSCMTAWWQRGDSNSSSSQNDVVDFSLSYLFQKMWTVCVVLVTVYMLYATMCETAKIEKKRLEKSKER